MPFCSSVVEADYAYRNDVTDVPLTGYQVVLSPRDTATAETKAKSEDSFLRVLNSYVQSMAIRDPKYFVTMPSVHIEYLCQLAYEGKPVEGPAGRSKLLAEQIGAANLAKIKTLGRGVITVLRGMQSSKAEPFVRKTMLSELILFHRGRVKRKELGRSSPLTRRKPYPYLDDDFFNIIVPKAWVKNLVWDENTLTSRFRCKLFSDIVKVEGINLTEGHKWKHLRLQATKTWRDEISEWKVTPTCVKFCYIREKQG